MAIRPTDSLADSGSWIEVVLEKFVSYPLIYREEHTHCSAAIEGGNGL